MSKKTMVLMAHRNLGDSVLNKNIKKVLEKEDDIIYKDLKSLYDGFKIDVQKAQDELSDIKKLVFQFPLYWYSAPAILKQWVDEVLAYGFSYEIDENGNFQPLALKDKEFQMVVTIGAKEEAYKGEGRLSVLECLNSYSYTAKILGMREIEPYLIYGASFENYDEKKLNNLTLEVKKRVLEG